MVSGFLIVGAGISGATLARVLAEAGYPVTVIDERDHVAGNCHTEIHRETGILLHVYGPHIFHTDDDEVWRFVSRFATFVPYRHRVMAITQGQVFRLPINLHTLGQFFGRVFTPSEAKEFLTRSSKDIDTPISFEEQALATIGAPLYEAFFKGYTMKQWGRDPAVLPASILKRLPVRFSYDDNYFHHRRQAMPENGYTAMVENMLSHDNITTKLSTHFEKEDTSRFRHVFYSGPIDRYFNYCAGRLAYRTLDFEQIVETGDIQGTAVVNYCDIDVPHTRITEHRHLSPWRADPAKSVAFIEVSREARPSDIPYYPVRLVQDKENLAEYRRLASNVQGVTFFGRLGSYRYIDMDQAIAQALELGRRTIGETGSANSAPASVFSIQ